VSTSLTFDEHLASVELSGGQLAEFARQAGLDAAVPTCPEWQVAQLVAHQAMVHRWAAAHIRGSDPDVEPADTEILASTADLLAFYDEGLGRVVAALRDAPPDLEAFTFLKDPPAPREFWARRQAHETTIHRVDAHSALLGRTPSTDEAGIPPAFAADGLDELLRGFFTRGKSKLFDGKPFVAVVAPDDVDRRWVLRVDERLTVDAGDDDVDDADARLTGSAAALYLALWNRGDEIDVRGRPDVLERWHETQRVTWS
jgi:uncharacterized protein (TIGR03083 family)